jgi:hypothetical protein
MFNQQQGGYAILFILPVSAIRIYQEERENIIITYEVRMAI